jgi:hypothetical protein
MSRVADIRERQVVTKRHMNMHTNMENENDDTRILDRMQIQLSGIEVDLLNVTQWCHG